MDEIPEGFSGPVINVLPREADVDWARYELDEGGNLTVTEHESFSLYINEFGFM